MAGKKDSRPPKGSAGNSKDGKKKQAEGKTNNHISIDGKTPRDSGANQSNAIVIKASSMAQVKEKKFKKPSIPIFDEAEDDWEKSEHIQPIKACQKARISHILCVKKAKLEEAREKLENGEDWNAVCRKYADEKAEHGGLLGDVSLTGVGDKTFLEIAGKTPISTSSKKVYTMCRSQYGYHIIKVDAKS